MGKDAGNAGKRVGRRVRYYGNTGWILVFLLKESFYGAHQLSGTGDDCGSAGEEVAGGCDCGGKAGPENQAIRAHQPDVMRSFTSTFDLLFKKDKGTVEWDLKELLRAYIALSMSCGY